MHAKPAMPTMPVTAALESSALYALEHWYRDQVGAWFAALTFQGVAAASKPVTLPLKDVFVELDAVVNAPDGVDVSSVDERRLLLEAERDRRYSRSELLAHLDAMRLERWRHEQRQARRPRPSLASRPVSAILAKYSQLGLVILGDPGSGKSTLLRHQALQSAAEPVGGLLPIYVPIAAYDEFHRREPALGLGEFLPIYHEHWRSAPGLQPLFGAALAAGRALVLLDGLDEVLDVATRQFVAQQAADFIQQWAERGNRCVVSSRVVGYREAMLPGELCHATLLDLNRHRIERYAHQWCRAAAVGAAGGQATPAVLEMAAAEEQALLTEIRATPGVEQLAANPLLLSMLALLRREIGRLPGRRAQLYAQFIAVLMTDWPAARSPLARSQLPVQIDRDQACTYLGGLAFWLLRNRPSGVVTRADLLDELAAIILRDRPLAASAVQRQAAALEAATFLQTVCESAGLLVERGRDIYGFLHLTFQEYFAGWALAGMEPAARWAVLQPVLHQPRWREPILLCAGQLGSGARQPGQVTDLVWRILTAGSAHEQLLHRDLFLAAAFAMEDVGVTPAVLLELGNRLAPLVLSPVPAVRDQALVALAHLVRLGCPTAAEPLLAALADPELRCPAIAATSLLLGEPALERVRAAVIDLLSEGDDQVVHAAAYALAPFLLQDGAVQQAFMTGLLAHEGWQRERAVEWLAPAAAHVDAVKAALLFCCADSHHAVRLAACAALAPLALSDEQVQATLRACLTDLRLDVRQVVLAVLAPLAVHDASVLAALVGYLQDRSTDLESDLAAVTGYVQRNSAFVRYDLDGRTSALAIAVASNEPLQAMLIQLLSRASSAVRSSILVVLMLAAAQDPAVRALLIEHLDDESPEVRYAAARVLAPLGARDGAVTAVLLAHLPGSNEWAQREIFRVITPLALHDHAVLKALLALLAAGNRAVQQELLRALPPTAAGVEPVRTALLDLLGDGDGFLRAETIRLLAPVAPQQKSVQLALCAGLSDAEAGVRAAAVAALAPLAPGDAAIKARLAACLSDEAEWVRSAAVAALTPLILDDATLKPRLLACLHDRNEWVRDAAIKALTPLAGKDAEVKAALAAQLSSTEWDVRVAAIGAVGRLAASDSAVKAALINYLQANNAEVKCAAIEALTPVAAGDEAVQAALLAQVAEASGAGRDAAVAVLAPLATHDEAIKLALLAHFEQGPGAARTAVIAGLAPLAPTDPAVLALLLGSLQAEETYLRAAAVAAAAFMAPVEPKVQAALVACLDATDPGVRRAAIQALAPLARKDAAVTAALLACLRAVVADAPRPGLPLLSTLPLLLAEEHVEVVRALSAATGAPDVKSALVELLDAESSALREAAVAALTPLAAADETVLTALLARLGDRSSDVQTAAVTALAPLAAENMRVRAALAALIAMDNELRGAASEALAPLAASDDTVAALLLPLLTDDDPFICNATFSALAPAAAQSETVKATFVALLSSSDFWQQDFAVAVLAPLAVHDAALRTVLVGRLQTDDRQHFCRTATWLAKLAPVDATVRAALLQCLQEDKRVADDHMRQSAVDALSPMVTKDAAVRQALLASLDDAAYPVRVSAAWALIRLVASDSEVQERLAPWLGTDSDEDEAINDNAPNLRAWLIRAYAQAAATSPAVCSQLERLLDAVAAETRLSAAQALATMPGGPPVGLLPKLRRVLSDMRSELSWSFRLAVAAVFLNDRDRDLSQMAITTAAAALDFATQPWYNLFKLGKRVRTEAAILLGQLEPLYHDAAVFARLARVLVEDQDEDVRDAAYGAMLRLAAAPVEA